MASKLYRNILEFYGTIGVPLVYLWGLYLIAQGQGQSNELVAVAGGVLALAGLLLWVKSYRGLGRAFGVLPRRQKRVKTGVYKYLAHPMYVGIMMTYLGLALATGSFQGMIFSVLLLLPLLAYRAYRENKLLE